MGDLSPSLKEYGGTFPIPATGLNFGITGPLLEVQTAATDFIVINEILLGRSFGKTGAGASYVLGVGRPAAMGVGVHPTSYLYNDGGNSSSPPAASIYTWWTIPPTIPNAFFRRFTILAAQPGEMIPSLFFARGIKLNPSSSLVVWMIATGNTSGPILFDPQISIEG